jgi:mannosyltransferase OCH1-like enzyme
MAATLVSLAALSICGFAAVFMSDFVIHAWLQDYSGLRMSSAEPKGESQVPKIVHHTWKNEDIPMEWRLTLAACKRMYSDFEFFLWTDAKSRDLIRDEFPWFLSTYDSYWHDIQRADVIRYFVLEKYGGTM